MCKLNLLIEQFWSVKWHNLKTHNSWVWEELSVNSTFSISHKQHVHTLYIFNFTKNKNRILETFDLLIKLLRPIMPLLSVALLFIETHITEVEKHHRHWIEFSQQIQFYFLNNRQRSFLSKIFIPKCRLSNLAVKKKMAQICKCHFWLFSY